MPRGNSKPRFFYGWLVAIAASLVMVVCFGVQYSFGVFFKPLIAEFGWTRAATSGIFSLYMIMRGSFGLVMGWFSDRHSPRIAVTIGAISMGLGLFLTSRADAIWQLYILYSVMVGLGAGSFYSPLASTLSRWFIEKRGLALGIFTAGVGLGTVVFSPLSEYLISTYDWRTSYVILGVIAWVITLSGAYCIRRSPEEMGLLPDGRKASSEIEQASNQQDCYQTGLSLRNAVKRRAFWVLLIISAISFFCVLTPMVHLVAYATDSGISPMTAANILAIVGGCGILSRLGMGTLSDRVGAKNLLAIALATQALMLFFVMQARGEAMFYIFAVIFGLAYGGTVPLMPMLTAEYFGVSSMGTIFAAVQFTGTIGGAFGPVIAGRIYDILKSYNLAFLIVGAVAAVGALLSVYLKILKEAHMEETGDD